MTAYLALIAIAALALAATVLAKNRELSHGKADAERDIELQKSIVLKTITHYSRRLEAEVASRTKELTRAHKQIVSHEKMVALGVFTAGMAHEINNPANFVSVGAQNAAEQIREFHEFIDGFFDEDTPADVREAFHARFVELSKSISIIKTGSDRIEHVVKSLRSMNPGDEEQLSPADLVETLTNVWDMLTPIAKTTILTRTEYRARPVVECVVPDISQVFIALLSNAVHSIEDASIARGSSYHGEVLLCSYLDGDRFYVTVTDNGMGIPAALLDKIFDPFFTTKGVGRGSGLGLSMSRDVIQRHNGTLEVQSTPGRGATFIMGLPLRQH